MNVAIIASSTKSVRIPGKNIQPVGGKPMITYPIRAAIDSGMFDQVIVTTADDETKSIVREAGARVFPSPAGLQRKDNTVANCCHSVLTVLRDVEGVVPDYFCCIYATAIFLEPDDFRKSADMLQETDFVMGVSPFIYEPAHAMVYEGGYLRVLERRALRYKAPSFPTKFSSNGTLYWCRTEPFMAIRDFYGPRLKGYEMPRLRVVDINTPDDLELARMLMDKAHEKQELPKY